MTTSFILIGVFGQSSLVGTLEILTMTSNEALSTALPKTGCLDSPGENQSRFELGATLTKNCLRNQPWDRCHT